MHNHPEEMTTLKKQHRSWYPLKLYFQIPCVFPVFFPCPTANFPCANLCNLCILEMEIFTENIAISFTFRIREFTT